MTNKNRQLGRIKRYIKDIRTLGGDEDALVETFTEGYCYEFAAYILKSWFPEGEVYFSPEKQHYIFKYLDRYWDIRGELELSDKEIEELIIDEDKNK